MAGTTRLELATSAVTGQRSNQLNYVPTNACQKSKLTFCPVQSALLSQNICSFSKHDSKKYSLPTSLPQPAQIQTQLHSQSKSRCNHAVTSSTHSLGFLVGFSISFATLESEARIPHWLQRSLPLFYCKRLIDETPGLPCIFGLDSLEDQELSLHGSLCKTERCVTRQNNKSRGNRRQLNSLLRGPER
jgi:hypothetical protein